MDQPVIEGDVRWVVGHGARSDENNVGCEGRFLPIGRVDSDGVDILQRLQSPDDLNLVALEVALDETPLALDDELGAGQEDLDGESLLQRVVDPYSPRWRKPEKYSAVSRSVFEVTVPVLRPAPRRYGARSTRTTCLPKYAACAAPFSPAGPEPMTTRS